METLNLGIAQNLGIIIIAIGVLAIVTLVLALQGRSRAAFVARRFSWAKGDASDSSSDSLLKLLQAVEVNIKDIRNIQVKLEETISEGRHHFKSIGLVRYDAFDGIAGQQSYSLCILDAEKTGILISNLVGSNFNRGYAVEVKEGLASRKLGEEEDNALKAALAS